MTTADEAGQLARLERDRRDADARYNGALTALDRAIVAVGEKPSLAREDFARVATALIVFLQQITAFVETKDRELEAVTDEKIASVSCVAEPVAELRAQMTILQRAVQALSRRPEAPSTAQFAQAPIAAPPTVDRSDDHKYLAFEDQFRGTDEAVAQRLKDYVPLFAGAGQHPIVDIGCGRGELLRALKASGRVARGVDANSEMVATARATGIDATHGDALAFLEAIEDASLGGIAATQVVEHLEPSYLSRLLDAAARKLRRGAPIVLETINPACWLAFFSSYIRDLTHVRPIHPETLQYLLRASGFERVEIRYRAPVPDHMKMKTFDLPIEMQTSRDATAVVIQGLAHAVNANAVILNNLMFTHLDYAAVAYRV